MKRIIKVSLLLLLCLALLISGGVYYVYYYYRVAEHTVFKTSDANSRLYLNVTCKYGGGETYYSYVVVRMPNGREVSRVELCCGQEDLGLCFSEHKNITGMSLDFQNKTVRIDFSSKPYMLIPVSFNTSYAGTR
jgi:hypothetical protein